MLLTRCKNYHLYQLSQTEQEIQKAKTREFGDRILVMGSCFLDCQVAVELAEQGKEVIIIERLDELLHDCLHSPMRAELMKRLEALVVLFYLETIIIKVEKDQVYLMNQENIKTSLTVDTIIVPKNYEFC